MLPAEGKLVMNTDLKPARKPLNNDLGGGITSFQSNKTLEPGKLASSNSNDKIGHTLQKPKNNDYEQTPSTK